MQIGLCLGSSLERMKEGCIVGLNERTNMICRVGMVCPLVGHLLTSLKRICDIAWLFYWSVVCKAIWVVCILKVHKNQLFGRRFAHVQGA